jgi:hypothetical protein
VFDMPDDKRVNLSHDLDALLRDVKVATEEVKQQQDANKLKEAKAVEKEKSRKQSTVIIALAAVALLVVAYFVIFAGPGENEAVPVQVTTPRPAPKVTTTAPSSGTTTTRPATPMMPANPGRVGSQVTDRPSDDYEQPGGGGM